MPRLPLLLVTLALAVALSVGMWAAGVVRFDWATFTLHVASIYIGVAGVVLFQDWHRNRRDLP